MTINKNQKEIIKSYLRSVAVATVTTVLALVADVRPEFAILAGAASAIALETARTCAFT